LGLLCSGAESLYPPRKSAFNHRKVFVAPGSGQLSDVNLQVLKAGTTNILDPRFREQPLLWLFLAHISHCLQILLARLVRQGT
jgi:hypothetical protein